MDGFITRRGGAAGSSRVLSATFKGKGSTTITVPELIGAKCFYITHGGLVGTPADATVHSLSYFAGESSCLYGKGVYNGSSVSPEYTYSRNGETFDSATGTITASAEFDSGGSYYLWASF